MEGGRQPTSITLVRNLSDFSSPRFGLASQMKIKLRIRIPTSRPVSPCATISQSLARIKKPSLPLVPCYDHLIID